MRLIGTPSLRHLLEVAEEARDLLDVLGAQLLALAAQALAHLLPEAAGVDQLHLALAVLRLAVADDPDVGADAGVVEHDWTDPRIS